MPSPQLVSGVSNRAFLEDYAAPGRVGLAGGADVVSRLIARAQRHLDEEKRPSLWSHAFIFQGTRADGRHWVFESDLEVHRKNIRLGVQENRFEKFCDENAYPMLAVVDFGLAPSHVEAVFREALDMVAGRIRYSLRELMGTLIGMRHPSIRARPNPLSRRKSLFCSAFVTHVLRKAGIDPAPGFDVKHTAPEDLFRSEQAAHIWLLQKDPEGKPTLASRIARRVRGRLQKMSPLAE
jgi:hypothetical protein